MWTGESDTEFECDKGAPYDCEECPYRKTADEAFGECGDEYFEFYMEMH
jgi:hypothetical protein